MTGVWSPAVAEATLRQLRALQDNVEQVLARDAEKEKGRATSSCRLHMLAEVLSLVRPPLAAACGEDGGAGAGAGVRMDESS